jgi:flagellar L-ring protein precursor FlgH
MLCLLPVMLLSACAMPKRGDPEYAPAMPRYVYTPPQDSGSIYHQGTAMLLNEDLKARRVGDMIIVTLKEQTDAQKQAATGTAKTTNASITNPTLAGKPFSSNGKPLFDASLASDQAFDGSGQSKQSNSLSGSVTVTVVEVLANGNLVVQGEKWININQGEEYIRLRGIVRPTDINADNTIASTRVADAQIQYSGDSTLDDSNNMGWLAKIFNSPWMPF